MTARRDDIDGDDLARLYAEGMSTWMLARRFKASQPTIRRILAEHGVEPRTFSEAGRVRWVRDRDAAMAAFDKGLAKRRGRRTDAAMRAQALAKQRSGKVKVGRAEYPLREHLNSLGVEYVPQFAVDRYNIDIAVVAPRIAIEVEQHPHYPLGRPATARRAEYLRERRWAVVFVWCHNHLLPERGAAERIVSHADLLSRDPSLRGEYLVIRRNGEDAVRLSGVAKPTGRKAQP